MPDANAVADNTATEIIEPIREVPAGFRITGIVELEPDAAIVVDDQANMRWKSHTAASIKEMAQALCRGQLQPVGILPLDENMDSFLLTYGYRRWAGFQYAHEHEMENRPATLQAVTLEWVGDTGGEITSESMSKRAAAAIALSNLDENTSRKSLSTMDRVWAIYKLEQAGLQRKDIAARLGVGKEYVTRMAGVVYLPEEALELIDSGVVSDQIARDWAAIYAQTDEKKREKVILKLVERAKKELEKLEAAQASKPEKEQKKKKKLKVSRKALAKAGDGEPDADPDASTPATTATANAKDRTTAEIKRLLKAMGKLKPYESLAKVLLQFVSGDLEAAALMEKLTGGRGEEKAA